MDLTTQIKIPKNKPRLIVFDINDTLFSQEFSTKKGFHFVILPNIERILHHIKNVLNIPIAIASMGHNSNYRKELLKSNNLWQYFDDESLIIIHGGKKTRHFKTLVENFDKFYGEQQKQQLQNDFEPLKYDEIIFFDDKKWNHELMGPKGVHGYTCEKKGVTIESVDVMLKKYDKYVESDRTIKFPETCVWTDK